MAGVYRDGVLSGYSAPVGGALPWGGDGGMPGGSPAQIAQSYNQSYNSALAMNQSGYQNILAGYQQSLAAQATAQQAIQAGYSDLYNQVMTQVKDVGQSRQTDINDAAARGLAQGTQSLVNRGLGNTTIQNSLDRGIENDRSRASIQNDESIARMLGDYMTQHGLAGLNNQSNAVRDLTNQQNQQLAFMNSVQARYPDAGMYGQLAMQAGQLGRDNRGGGGGGGYGGGSFFGGGGGAAPKLGYVPSGGPYYGSGGYTPTGAAPTGFSGGAGGSFGGGSSYGGYGGGDYGGGGDFGSPNGFDFGAMGGAVAGGFSDAGYGAGDYSSGTWAGLGDLFGGGYQGTGGGYGEDF